MSVAIFGTENPEVPETYEINSEDGRTTETGSFHGHLSVNKIVNEPDGRVWYYFDAPTNLMMWNEPKWSLNEPKWSLKGHNMFLSSIYER